MALLTENRGGGEEALGGEKQELLGHVRSVTPLGCPGKTQEESSVHTSHGGRIN